MTFFNAGANGRLELQPHEYSKNPKSQITYGLSEQASEYVDERIKATTQGKGKDELGIFNQYGLMPEDGMVFLDFVPEVNRSYEISKMMYGKKIDDNTWQSEDGRLKRQDNEDGTITVYYDSDGDKDYDRTATYAVVEEWTNRSDSEQDFPYWNKNDNNEEYKYFKDEDYLAGNGVNTCFMKIEETFDDNGDGIPEIRLTRSDFKYQEEYTTEVPNPNYKESKILFIKWGNGEPKTITQTTDEYMAYTTTAAFNSDGGKCKLGDHYEFMETAFIENGSYNAEQSEQMTLEWVNSSNSDGAKVSETYNLSPYSNLGMLKHILDALNDQ